MQSLDRNLSLLRRYAGLKTTRCVAHNFWAIDGGRGGRPPARVDARLQQLRRSWLMVPPGDRAEATESRTIEHQINITGVHHDIMGELVLNDHIYDHVCRRLREAPSHDILQTPQRRQLIAQAVCLCRREACKPRSHDVHVGHCASVTSLKRLTWRYFTTLTAITNSPTLVFQ